MGTASQLFVAVLDATAVSLSAADGEIAVVLMLVAFTLVGFSTKPVMQMWEIAWYP